MLQPPLESAADEVEGGGERVQARSLVVCRFVVESVLALNARSLTKVCCALTIEIFALGWDTRVVPRADSLTLAVS